MRPDDTNPYERGGVLNPAAVLHNGVTYIFYRAVAETPYNYSRILMATCKLGEDNNIEAVRLGRVALEPEADYELWKDAEGAVRAGGVEDPRITAIGGTYYMAYTAYGNVGGSLGPRIALTRSHDLFAWERMGLVSFGPLDIMMNGESRRIDLALVPNKDAI